MCFLEGITEFFLLSYKNPSFEPENADESKVAGQISSRYWQDSLIMMFFECWTFWSEFWRRLWFFWSRWGLFGPHFGQGRAPLKVKIFEMPNCCSLLKSTLLLVRQAYQDQLDAIMAAEGCDLAKAKKVYWQQVALASTVLGHGGSRRKGGYHKW